MFHSKKSSLTSSKCTILKSKKSMQGVGPKKLKNKSENVTPKKNKHYKKLYDYKYTVQQSSQGDNKPKITMNVSIDLSQTQKQNIIFIDKSG